MIGFILYRILKELSSTNGSSDPSTDMMAGIFDAYIRSDDFFYTYFTYKFIHLQPVFTG